MTRKRLQIGDFCKHGHLLTKSTLYVDHSGKTRCAECCSNLRKHPPSLLPPPERSKNQERYHKNKEALKLVRVGLAPSLVAARALV